MQATLDHHFEAGRLYLFPGGEWVIAGARELEQRLQSAFPANEEPGQLVIDLTELVGARYGRRVPARERASGASSTRGGRVAWRGADAGRARLIERVRTVVAGDE